MMVEVFKTNVTALKLTEILIRKLHKRFPGSRANFDIEDCDNILRVEADHIVPHQIIEVLNAHGCYCEVLD